jgi:outer membrane protein assembly factor BamB
MSLRNLILLASALVVAPAAARADDWPQWMGEKRDNVWRETGILDKFPAAGSCSSPTTSPRPT